MELAGRSPEIAFAGNAAWWGGPPNWQSIRMRPVVNNGARVAALLAGDAAREDAERERSLGTKGRGRGVAGGRGRTSGRGGGRDRESSERTSDSERDGAPVF